MLAELLKLGLRYQRAVHSKNMQVRCRAGGGIRRECIVKHVIALHHSVAVIGGGYTLIPVASLVAV